MSVANFIPEVWAAVAEAELRKTLVYAQPGIINRNYEGEIANQGDTVRINMIGPVTIGDYSKETAISAPEFLDSSQTTLVVDQSKYYNFAVDDIDMVQTKPKLMESFISQAQYGMADVIDQYVAGLMEAAVPTANTIGTVASPKDDLDTVTGAAYNYLVDLSVLLDNAKVPASGRWAIVPPWVHGWLLKDDRFVKSGTPAGDAILRNGVVGEAAGFRVIKSVNVPNTSATKYKIIAGVDSALTFASQLVKTEAYRPESYFADAFKGLHVYGAKVVFPNRLAMLIANNS